MAKKIICKIGKDGKVNIEAVGYNGVGCEEATRAFEEALGGQVEERIKKNQLPDELVERENYE